MENSILVNLAVADSHDLVEISNSNNADGRGVRSIKSARTGTKNTKLYPGLQEFGPYVRISFVTDSVANLYCAFSINSNVQMHVTESSIKTKRLILQ